MLYQGGEPNMMQRDDLCAASFAWQSRVIGADQKLPPGVRPPGLHARTDGATPRSALRGVVRFGLLLMTVKGVLHGLWFLIGN